jgi:hypothetical protein
MKSKLRKTVDQTQSLFSTELLIYLQTIGVSVKGYKFILPNGITIELSPQQIESMNCQFESEYK